MGAAKPKGLKGKKKHGKKIHYSKKPLAATKAITNPGVTTIRSLRSGDKVVQVVAVKKGYRKNPNMLIPDMAYRSHEPRKSMTNKHTSMIVKMGSRNQNLEQQRKTARLINWKKVSIFDEEPEFQLKDNGLARCHILADSRIQIIVPVMVKSLSNRFGAIISKNDLQKPELEFIEALLGQTNWLTVSFLVEAVNKTTQGICNAFDTTCIVNALSLGENNLYLGDASRNGDISNGFDMLFDEKGHPDPRAIRIRDAVLGLSYAKLIPHSMAMNATTPTRDKRTGMAQTSSERGEYDAHEQMDWRPNSNDPGPGYSEW